LLLIFILQSYSLITNSYPLHIYIDGENIVVMVMRENSSIPIIIYTNSTINVNGTVKIFAFSYDPKVIIEPNYTEVYVNNETTILIKAYKSTPNSEVVTATKSNVNSGVEDLMTGVLPAVLILIGFLLLLRGSNKLF